MKTTKIKGKFVIGHDGTSHVVYRDGEVVYEGDTITFVGRGYDGHVDETIDTGTAIVGPGANLSFKDNIADGWWEYDYY